jgi:dolichyl-phosphate-mannose-protein mannosyltransferase
MDVIVNVMKYDSISAYLVICWATHYVPFYLMQRQLFLHHYFPSLYFSIFQLATVFDFSTSRLAPKARLKAFALILLMAFWSWAVFTPITYASSWTRSQCERARWKRSWDFGCHDFPEHVCCLFSCNAYSQPKRWSFLLADSPIASSLSIDIPDG